MTTQYIAQLHLPIKSASVYLDCGILFPFYFKDSSVNVARWLGDVCGLTSKYSISTTFEVWQEARTAYKNVPICKNQQKQVRTLYDRVDDVINKVSVRVDAADIHHHNYKLSKADLSLYNRPDTQNTLITADKELFERDTNSILLSWDPDANSLSYLDGQS